MSNVVEFAVGERKVMFTKDNLPLLGAVLGTLSGKPNGLSRFGVLKDGKVVKVLQSRKITKETEQVAEIGKTFSDLHGKGVITLTNGKVPEAKIVSEYNDLSNEVIQMAEKIEVPAVTGAKRGRPAGSGKAAEGKDNSVQRNPAPVKAKRYSLVGDKVVQWTIGKPSKDQRLTECDENGKIIADIEAITAQYAAAEEAKAMKVQRNPTAKVGGKRFYLKDGVVTPFGLGKPGVDKLSNECTQAGEKIDNSAQVALMRQPKQSSSTGGNTSKINALEAQIAQLTQMMQQMMVGFAAPAVPQQIREFTDPAAVAAQAAVEVAQVTETVAEKPAKVAKPAKADKSPKVKKIVDEDPYETFANESSSLDAEPIAFGSDGFVVTEIDC